MDLLEAIRLHRSAPHFRADPVRPEHLKLLVEAAARSPSHFNSQPWRFILITDGALRDSLDQLINQQNIAPVRMGIALNRSEYRPGELQGLYSAITLGAVVQTFSLVSASLSMGFRFIEIDSYEMQLSEQLGIPADWQLVAWFALGYLQDRADAPISPSIETLVSSNLWEQPTPEALRRAPSLLWDVDKK